MNPHKQSIVGRGTLWLNRMLLKRLLSLSDTVLHDMGLSREEVAWACELPLWKDAAREMRKAADARLRAQCLRPAE